MIDWMIGDGSVAVWDQGMAAARDKLRRSSAFVLVTVDRETRQMDFHALSCDLDGEGMTQLISTTLDVCADTLIELDEAEAA